MSTEPIQFHKIEAYNCEGKFLGYVADVKGRGAIVNCRLVEKPYRFPQRRGQSILRSAKTASVCTTPDGKKFYPRNDKLTFKMVEL